MSNPKLLVNSSNNKSGYKSCLDISAKQIDHGEYFTPLSSACMECQCVNGAQDHCISVVCQKPKCLNFKEIPGKCCEYKCPDLTMSDNTTLAVVVTLSCLLVLILSATVIVWWKLRRKKSYGERLDSITSANSSNLDIGSLIRHNSIPNNTRFINSLKATNVDCSNTNIKKPNIEYVHVEPDVSEANSSNVSKTTNDVNNLQMSQKQSFSWKDNQDHQEDTKLSKFSPSPQKQSKIIVPHSSKDSLTFV